MTNNSATAVSTRSALLDRGSLLHPQRDRGGRGPIYTGPAAARPLSAPPLTDTSSAGTRYTRHSKPSHRTRLTASKPGSGNNRHAHRRRRPAEVLVQLATECGAEQPRPRRGRGSGSYVVQVDDGLGDANFLDELVPVDGQQLGNTTPGDSRKPEGGEDGDLPVNQAAPRRGPQATIPTHNPLDGGSNPPRPISGKPRSERGSPPSGTQSLAPRSADWATPSGGFEGGNRQMRKNRVSLDLKDHVCRRRFSGERADRPTATDRQPACRAGPSFPRANLEYRTACPSSR